jgi:hypothetical protein
MPEDYRPNDNQRPPKPGGDSRFPHAGGCSDRHPGFLPLLFMLRRQADTRYQQISPSEFFTRLAATQIVSGTITFRSAISTAGDYREISTRGRWPTGQTEAGRNKETASARAWR